MDDSQTVLDVSRQAHEAADKFDYFVCTVGGAIFAYDAEHYIPKRIGFDVFLLEPISLLLFGIGILLRPEAYRILPNSYYIEPQLIGLQS